MSQEEFVRQAENCSGQALAYVGQAESLVLLRIAGEFDRLAKGECADPLPSQVFDDTLTQTRS